MRDPVIDAKRLGSLPHSIWMPGEPPSVYCGSPKEMVSAMAQEMGLDLSLREAVDRLCAGLAEHRRVVIGLPDDVPEDTLAQLFVCALLDTGMARPVAAA